MWEDKTGGDSSKSQASHSVKKGVSESLPTDLVGGLVIIPAYPCICVRMMLNCAYFKMDFWRKDGDRP